jgi:ketosteroid isomerase-like protein
VNEKEDVMQSDIERSRNRATVEAFLNVFPQGEEGFFQARKRLGLIADDYVFELPYAPPGSRSVDAGADHERRGNWLKTMFVEWRRTKGPIIYETTDPTVFWVEASGEGKVRFWGDDMEYHNDFVIMFVVENGKVRRFKEYYNPINLYPPGTLPPFPFSG